MPLCLRPSIHVTRMEDLMAWRREVLKKITLIGDSFEALDGGPNESELKVGIFNDQANNIPFFAPHSTYGMP